MLRPFSLSIVTASFILAALSHAQVQPGLPNFSAYDMHEVDTVNLMNNSVILNVPIMSKSGAFPFQLGASASSYMISAGSWAPSMDVGVSIAPGAPFEGVVDNLLGPYTISVPLTNYSGTCLGHSAVYYTNWMVQTGDGTYHFLPSTDQTIVGLGSACNTSFTDITYDGSGFTVSATGASTTSVYARGGMNITHLSLTDANGNSISAGGPATAYGQPWLDTLGLNVAAQSYSAAQTYSWNDVGGGVQQVTQATNSFSLRTAFGCSGTSDVTSGPQPLQLTTGFSYPDGTSLGFTYEVPSGYSLPDVTGRINTITQREGGVVTYSYLGGSHGINCTRAVAPELQRVTSDGTTTYTLAYSLITGSQYKAVNTVVDNGGNTTKYTFTGFNSTGFSTTPGAAQILTSVQKFKGPSTSLVTEVYCYNMTFASASFSSCPTAAVFYPITSVVVLQKIAGLSNLSAKEVHYDAYGNVTYSARYDFGASTPTRATTITYYQSGTSCGALSSGSHVNNKPCEIATTDGTNTIADSKYTYDANGNLKTTSLWTGSGWIGQTAANTYNPNGTPLKTFDLANNETDYAYDAGSYVCSSTSIVTCPASNLPFPTSITKGGLATSSIWYAIGGVKKSDTDANTNTTTYGYATDPFWRVRSVTDPYLSVVNRSYPSGSSPTTASSSFTFNSSTSIEGGIVTSDGYGRAINAQKYQSPSGSNYDTVSTVYGWSGTTGDRTVASSEPCSTTFGNSCSTVHTSDIDPLGRLYTEVTASNETITNTYSENDLLSALTPAPSGENPKQVQTETDGLGRISKVCAIGNGSSTGCSQNTGTANGVTDSYAYTSGAGWTQAAITRGSQVRSTTFDALGRVIRRTTPEGGTWTYLYDVQSGCPSSVAGHLTVVLDPNGNGICFYYDALGRNVAQSANTANCRFFYYDNSTGFTGTRPTGISPTYSLGRIVSAATSESAGCNTLTTDEWFSYDKDGRVTDTWQSTPHSSQYYHSVATFFENGKVKTLQLASPSLYTMSYTLDGEGRWNTLTDNTSSTNVVTDATFFPAANPAVVKFQGTTPDNDAYTFDSNTGRMTQYAFSVGNTPVIMTGGLNWNPNGTLKQLTITDGFNSGGTQTCTFNPTLASGTGYDDLGRIVGVDCGSGGWGQTFSYDMYDNLSKTVMSGRTGTNWNPTYSATTNRYNCGVACTYDANGNVTGDSNNVFGWNEYSKMKWTASSGTPTCGASGMCITYDAFGRIVETSNNLAWRTRWITQLGETANMTGTTINFAYWPEPQGGTTVITGSSGAFYHLHKDWLGNARIASTITGHAVAADQAYSPYGEVYASFGATNSYFDLFAGTTSNFSNGVVWDTPNRELSVVGRWLSPDPAHMGWNQYAYEANPNGSIDPLGLGGCPAGQASCGGSHGPPGVGCTDRANTNPDCIKDIPTDPINGWDVFSLMQIPLVTWGCFGDCGYYPIGSGLDVFGSSTNTNDVNKTWTKTVACKKSATQVMSAVQHDMGQFADNFGFFTANFPDQPITMGGQYSIQPGAWIPTANLYGLPAVPLTISGKTLAVTVTSESTTGWTFTTDPSHHYFDGTVSFSSTDAGNGNVTFSITADANWVNSITQFTVGPLIMAGENSTWNNMLNNVQDYCSSPNGN